MGGQILKNVPWIFQRPHNVELATILSFLKRASVQFLPMQLPPSVWWQFSILAVLVTVPEFTVSEMQLCRCTIWQLHQRYIWESTVLFCHFADLQMLTLVSWCSKERIYKYYGRRNKWTVWPIYESPIWDSSTLLYIKKLGYTQKQTEKNI